MLFFLGFFNIGRRFVNRRYWTRVHLKEKKKNIHTVCYKTIALGVVHFFFLSGIGGIVLG